MMKKYLPKIKPYSLIEKVKLSRMVEELFLYLGNRPNTCLLHSSLKTSGRYSFIGIEPFMILRSKSRNIELKFNNHRLITKGDPFTYFDSILKTYKIDSQSLPFAGGGIGYFSYDLKNLLEELPQKAKDDLRLPDLYFVFYRVLLIHDNFEPNSIYISILDFTSSKYKAARELMIETKKNVKFLLQDKSFILRYKSYNPTLRANFTQANYVKAVRKAIDYIYAGDIYQVNLSQRFKTQWPYSAYELYLRLNRINPAPFSAYLNFEKFEIISSSPELFLKVQNGMVETRPMKGTRPRGKNQKEDQKFKDELIRSEKDKAELLMIIDLERNDLGKVAKAGSIKVRKYRKIETHPTVFQAISIVKGKINRGLSLIDIIKATFPGGSITGCPKIRAMEIIDELEPTARNIYTGALGYISFHHTMELNMVIRTIIAKKNDVYFQVGGGIVADSDPQTEYQETLDKAYALIKSLTVNRKAKEP